MLILIFVMIFIIVETCIIRSNYMVKYAYKYQADLLRIEFLNYECINFARKLYHDNMFILLTISILNNSNFYVVTIKTLNFPIQTLNISQEDGFKKSYHKDLEYVLFEIDKELIKIKKELQKYWRLNV